MKPLLANNLKIFLQRFNNFKNAELRSVEVSSPTTISVTFAAQDSARAFNWITITLTFEGVSDAKLIEINKLSFIDMSDGISLVCETNLIAFSIGSYNSIDAIKNANLFVISNSLKYQEGQF
ncbi:MAG TPA: hypothetical protein CFH84_06445 [Sulfurimonas sp. UBA12504]|nr:MAG: hypothetical protein A2019_02910 [Sulfurimonas sp. GWF2_37_8]DAB29992.1 MAG TPA: hypothetical protein CFH84_06445 [Sulfurimonas sp. UBA12504]